MLLQQIVETLDKELDRLQQLRDIVAGLQRPSILEDADSFNLAASVDAVPAAEAPRKEATSRKPRAKTPRASSRAATEQSALMGSIPAGPVVVSAAAVAQHHAKTAKQAAEKRPARQPEPGSLGQLIRALHLEANL